MLYYILFVLCLVVLNTEQGVLDSLRNVFCCFLGNINWKLLTAMKHFAVISACLIIVMLQLVHAYPWSEGKHLFIYLFEHYEVI